MSKAVTAKKDTLCPGLQRCINLTQAVTMYSQHCSIMAAFFGVGNKALIMLMHLLASWCKGLQSSCIQSLTGHTAGLIHFTHRYHNIFIQLHTQAVEEIFSSTHSIQLFMYYSIIQSTLACLFYDKISLTIAHIALFICKSDSHRLTYMSSYNFIYGNTLLSVRAKELLSI